MNEGNSILAYDIPKKTQQVLLEEKEYKDYADNVEFNQRGVPHHVLIGHGQDLATFEKRDLVTTDKMAYDEKQSAKQIIDPMSFRQENMQVQKIQINAKNSDVPAFMDGVNTKEQIKPKGYNEFTKRIDNNYNKIGLRK